MSRTEAEGRQSRGPSRGPGKTHREVYSPQLGNPAICVNNINMPYAHIISERDEVPIEKLAPEPLRLTPLVSHTDVQHQVESAGSLGGSMAP